jgi:hypothetical protein
VAEANLIYTTWGREFAAALSGICECSGQDAYEILLMTFNRELSLKEFHAMNADDLRRMRDCANEWFNTDRIESAHMQRAVEMLQAHWPIEKN